MLKKTTILNQLRILIGIAFIASTLVAIQGCYDFNIALKVLKKNYETPINSKDDLKNISNQLSQTVQLLEQASSLEKTFQTIDQSAKQDIYPALLKTITEQIDKKIEFISSTWINYSKTINSSEEKNIVDSFTQLFTESLKAQLLSEANLNQRPTQDKIEQRLIKVSSAVNTMQQLLSGLNSIEVNKYKIQQEEYENLSSLYKNLLINSIGFLAILLLLLVWFSRNINHTIHKYLGSSPESLYKFINEINIKNAEKDPLILKSSLINIKTAINTFQENIARLLADTQQIQYAVSIGDTTVRANTKQHSNGYRKTLETFNKILDQILVINETARNVTIVEPVQSQPATVTTVESTLEKIIDTGIFNQSNEDISRYADEALIASMTLAHMNTSQLEALQYAANHMQFLADSIEQNKSTTQQAHQLSLEIMQSAQNEERQLQAISNAIDSINKNTQKIQSQISIIDSIALQGDILAFNVAIEAARFGDEGRGFSVIATEVRNLSQRAINSTQTLKDLISDTFFITGDGNQRVIQAENTNRVIINQSNAISVSADTLRNAADKHANSIRELTQANTTADSNSLQQAMLSEYNRANTLRLHKSASELNELVHPEINNDHKNNLKNLSLAGQTSVDNKTVTFDSTLIQPEASVLKANDSSLNNRTESVLSELNQSTTAALTSDQELKKTEKNRLTENDWVLF